MVNILITRPIDQSAFLSEEIQKRGDRALICPFIDIIAETWDQTQLSDFLAAFDRLDDVVFISPTAVDMTVRLLSERLPAYRGHHRFFAAGQATAEAMGGSGFFSPDVCARTMYPSPDSGAEPLCQLEALSLVAGRHIGIIKGRYGRDYLQKELSRRKAIVSDFDLYYRRPANFNTADGQPLIEVVKTGTIDVMVITSSEALRYFYDWIKLIDDESIQTILFHTPLLVSHQRIERIAIDLGFLATFCTRSHNQAIISVLYQDVIPIVKQDNL